MFRPTSLLVCVAFAGAPAYGSALSLRTEASTVWAENINRASTASDWRDATRHEVRTSLSQFRQWTDGLVTTAELNAHFEHVPKYTRNDAWSGGLGGQVRQKFGWGAYAPVVAFDAGLRGRAARIDGDDGWTATAGLRVSRRLTSAWRVAAVGDWQQHYARSAVWDTRHHRLFGTVSWDITRRLQLSHGNGRLWGDFTANASPATWARAIAGESGTSISDYYKTVARGVTHAFGPNWLTYRVDGRVSFWWLELSPAIGRNTSLPLRYESLLAVNQVGIKYRQDIWSIQLLHRF